MQSPVTLQTEMADGRGSDGSFCVFQLAREPVQTLVEAISTGGTRSLDVPVTVAQGVQSQLVCDLGRVHGVGQVLRSEKKHTTVNKREEKHSLFRFTSITWIYRLLKCPHTASSSSSLSLVHQLVH